MRVFAGVTVADPAVPAALLARTEIALEAALRNAGPGRLDIRVALPRGGALPVGVDRDLAEATAALDAGLDRYLDMRMGEAADRLQSARDLFDKRLGWLGSADPLIEASLYLAMSRLADGDEGACQRVLQLLLLRLPDEDLPLSEFPPELADLLEVGRTRLKARSRLTVAAAPPGAHVIIDGRLRGRAPLTVDGLTEGRHALRIEAPGHDPWVRQISVGPGQARQPVRLDPGDPARTPLDLAVRSGAQSAFAGRILGEAGRRVLAVARFDRGRPGVAALAFHDLDGAGSADPKTAADVTAGAVVDPDAPAPSPAELVRWAGGAPPSEARAAAHLTLAVGTGAGLAEQVSEPGVAPVPVILALGLSTPLEGGWEAVGMMRAQPLEPRAYMALAAARYRPSGAGGALGLLLGGAFGQIAHTITDTETGRASVAGTVGLAGGVGLVGPIAGRILTLDLVATTLRPDFTFHVDLLLGTQIGL